MSNIYAVTGHRPAKLGGYDAQNFRLLRNFAIDVLSARMPATVITGMALGWDQAVAEACWQLDIPYIAAVPFQGQESLWPATSQAVYRRLLKDAVDIQYVCEPGFSAWKMQKRNEWMVDRCECLIALHDGSSGGTGNCVKYAERQKTMIDNVWKEWAAFKRAAA